MSETTMDGKVAAFAFLIVCLILAGFLLLRVISPLASGAVFAIALATLGGLSRGFRKGRPS
jgi:uncharacterized membrane protein